MPSSVNSNRPRKKKPKHVHPSKQQWYVKQPARNWLELPPNVMLNILHKVGVIDILESAQKVCTAWRKISKDPALWRVVFMGEFRGHSGNACREMSKQAVDRSQGQLLDFSITTVCSPDLLLYVADRSSQLRRIEIYWCTDQMCGIWSEALKSLSLLEELIIVCTKISQQDIEAAGSFCPLLKTLAVCRQNNCPRGIVDNELALAIGKHLPQLAHLELTGNSMTNIGLQAILDGCRHLESLDLRGCLNLDLKGDLGNRCSQQIKYLKLHNDSPEEGPPICIENDADDGSDDSADGSTGRTADGSDDYSDDDSDDSADGSTVRT